MLDHPTDTAPDPQPLITGMRMDRDEFIRRWEALPDLKRAELIEGTVFVPSPLGNIHSSYHAHMVEWLGRYRTDTPGTKAGIAPTTYMLESAPQPDIFLRITEECGGSSRDVRNFLHGAPELVVEICYSSTDYDYGPKLGLYQRAGVCEYITLDTLKKRLDWRMLVDGAYRHLAADADGVLRSRVFPGLWLDERHVWAEDTRAMAALLQQGLVSVEHQAFVERLSASM